MKRSLKRASIALPDGAEFTLSKRICGHIAKTAISNIFQYTKTIETCLLPSKELEAAHTHLDVIDAILPQLNEQMDVFLTLSRALEGVETSYTSVSGNPAARLGIETAALKEQISIVAPEMDFLELKEVSNVCLSVANDLAKEYETVRNRRNKADSLCRTLTITALARSDISADEQARIILNYDVPDGQDFLPPTPSYHDDGTKSYDPSDEAQIRNRAQAFLNVKENRALAARSGRKAMQREDIRSRIQGVWEDA